MNKTLVGTFFLVLIIAAAGCKKPNDTPPNTASVTFVNGCAGTTGIDAKVNGATVGGAANIGFLGNSGYKSVTAGAPVTLAYFLTNVGTPVSNQSATLTAGAHYTAFCSGLLTAPTFLLTTDDLAAPSSSNAKIRFVNLSPDNMSVTATAHTTKFADSITTLKASNFYPIVAGMYELQVADYSQPGTAVFGGTQQLAAGRIYTLILTGTINGTGPSELKLTLLTNN